MFERFTDQARRAVVFAREEARRLEYNYIGTEHLLLGLCRETDGIAAKALRSLDVSIDDVRTQVERLIGRGRSAPIGRFPFNPRAKTVLELSMREALQLGHNYIGTEHLLLGLVREAESGAARLLAARGADLNAVRQEVARQLATGAGDRAAAAKPSKEGLIADIEALYEEIVRLSREVHRLNELLRRHGIEPDEGTPSSA
jgi:ATP-dependent Clp protease ATP-binding subunit ClpC